MKKGCYEEGVITEYLDQDGILHQVIWENVLSKHFFLTKLAPICNGELRDQVG